MTKNEMIELLKTDVEKWNKWRKENSDIFPDLRGADLHGADLTGANLRFVNLEGANTKNVTFWGADLYGVKI